MKGQESVIDETEKVFIIVGGTLLLYFFVIKPYFEKLAEDKANKAIATEPALEKGGNTTIINTIPDENLTKNKTLLASYNVSDLATRISDTHGTFNDDEDQLYILLQIIPNKLVLQKLSLYFEAWKHASLLEYLASFLDASEMAKVSNILTKLPNSFTNK